MQRSTGQTVGAPHRVQSGASTGSSAAPHGSQSGGPGEPQQAQREGKSSSSSHANHGTAKAVTCLYQLCDSCVRFNR